MSRNARRLANRRAVQSERATKMLAYWNKYRDEKRAAGASMSLDEEDVMDCLGVTIREFATTERTEPDPEKRRADLDQFIDGVNRVLLAHGRPTLAISPMSKWAGKNPVTIVKPN